MSIDVLFVNWRDVNHPEGGGSERYVHRIAEGLAASGLRVIHVLRRPRPGSRRGDRRGRPHRAPRRPLRRLPPRPAARAAAPPARWSSTSRTGCRSAAPLVTRRPVVVLVHHVHREQWPIVFGRIGGAHRLVGRVRGRAAASTAGPVTSRCPGRPGDELGSLGIAAERVSVVPNGVEPAPAVAAARSAQPRLVVLGRLVPHKRVEHAVEVLARLQRPLARPAPVDRRRGLVGGRAAGARRRASASPTWWSSTASSTSRPSTRSSPGRGCTCARRSRRAGAWWSPRPAAHGVPTVGYRSAGGLRESILDGRTGVLVDDLDEMTEAVDRLLADGPARRRMGEAAARHAAAYNWAASVRGFAGVLSAAVRGSAAGPVLQDVDRLLVALLDRVLADRGLRCRRLQRPRASSHRPGR